MFKSQLKEEMEGYLQMKSELELLKKELVDTKNALRAAQCNFNYSDNNEMVEYYTYIVKANEIKYDYLSRKYRELQEELSAAERDEALAKSSDSMFIEKNSINIAKY